MFFVRPGFVAQTCVSPDERSRVNVLTNFTQRNWTVREQFIHQRRFTSLPAGKAFKVVHPEHFNVTFAHGPQGLNIVRLRKIVMYKFQRCFRSTVVPCTIRFLTKLAAS